jgi:hypothetical protein
MIPMGLPIRQTLNRLPASRTHRAVLIEVCELAAQKHGACTASNSYIGGRLLASERTVSRTICDLIAADLLLVQGEGKNRRLTPSSGLLACYAQGENLDNLAKLNLDNLAKKPRQPSQIGEVGEVDNLDKLSTEPSQVAHSNLDNCGSQPSQTGSRIIGDEQDDHSTTRDDQSASLRSALAAALQEVEDLKKKCEQLEVENTSLKAQPQASHTEGGAADVATPKPLRTPKARRTIRNPAPEVPFADTELADYERFAAAFEGTDYELLDLRFYHQKILNWRQKGEVPTRKDWKATAVTFFLNDRESNSLKLAPHVERYDASTHGAIGASNAVGSRPAPTGQGATGYRSSRYD